MSRLFHRFKVSLVASDPGLVRLRGATRSTIVIATSTFLLMLFAIRNAQPPTIAFLGIIVAMMASILVADATIPQQKVTFLLLPLPAMLALPIGTFLAQSHIAGISAFVALTFVVVAMRRFGARGTALGMIAFMTYFCALFFHATMDHVPWMMLAILIGLLVASVFQFWILPERRHRLEHWSRRAFTARIAITLRHLSQRLLMPQQAEESREILHQDLSRVTEAALGFEDVLKTGSFAPGGNDRRGSGLQTLVFELEFALLNLLEKTGAALCTDPALTEMRQRFSAELEALSDAFYPYNREQVRRHTETLRQMHEVNSEWSRAFETFAHVSEQFQENQFVSAVDLAPEEIAPRARVASVGIHASTRVAIQATLAVAMASIVGGVISPSRWSWAAMTAFVVFTGASRGDMLNRSVQRLVGTGFGLIVGIAIASLPLSKPMDVALIFISVFFGIYQMRVAYAWTTMWFTLMLFALYKMLGQLNPEIMVLRFEETLVGAVCGALAGMYVLPTYTRASISAAVADLLRTLSQSLTEGGQLRELDRSLQKVRAAAGPMTARLLFPRSPQLEGVIHDSFALVRFSRNLQREPRTNPETIELCRQLSKEARRLAAQIDELIAKNRRPRISVREHQQLLNVTLSGSSSESIERQWLDRIEVSLRNLRARFQLDSVSASTPSHSP